MSFKPAELMIYPLHLITKRCLAMTLLASMALSLTLPVFADDSPAKPDYKALLAQALKLADEIPADDEEQMQANALIVLADAYARTGDFEASLQLVDRVKDQLQCHMTLGLVASGLAGQEKNEDAQKVLQAALEEIATYEEAEEQNFALYELAVILSEQEYEAGFREVISVYEKQISELESDEEKESFLQNLAILLSETGNFEESAKALNQISTPAIQVMPLLNLSILQADAELLKEAKENWQKAEKQIEPSEDHYEQVSTLELLARAQGKTGDFEQMNSTLKNLETLINSSDQFEEDEKTSFSSGIGYTRYMAGDIEGAKASIANSIKAAEQKESAFDQFMELVNLTVLCLEVEDVELAKEITKKAEAKIPSIDADVRAFCKYTLVILLTGTGDIEKAKEVIKGFDTPDKGEDAEETAWIKQQSLIRLAQGLIRNGQAAAAFELIPQLQENSDAPELVDLLCQIAEALAAEEDSPKTE